jgi:hypothetical protein
MQKKPTTPCVLPLPLWRPCNPGSDCVPSSPTLPERPAGTTERGQPNLTFSLSFPRAVQSAQRMGASLPTRQRPTERRPVHRYSQTSSSGRTRTGGCSRASAVCPARQWRTWSSVMYRCCRMGRKVSCLENRCLGRGALQIHYVVACRLRPGELRNFMSISLGP